MDKKSHVVLICTPEMGNLVPLVEFAHLLTRRNSRLLPTILIMTLSQRPLVNAFVDSRQSSSTDINFVYLPTVDPPSPDLYNSFLGYLSLFIQSHKPHVKHAISNLISDSAPVAALFIDMFCTSMIDVADELGVPCYLHYASPASFLGMMLYYEDLDAQLRTHLVESSADLFVPKDESIRFHVPSFVNPLPPFVLPSTALKRNKDGHLWYSCHARRYKKTKGIVINTFRELETFSIEAISENGLPPVYPIGPILDLAGPARWHPDRAGQDDIIKWLDDQPLSSVVFLCFGSMGSLSGPQLREIAVGLERTGFRFLWSVRKPPKGIIELPGEYSDLNEVLPEGFLDRTAGIGLVCGWVPQVTILGHRAIGGFVSHCGWNSVSESLWYGVPIATWPVYAEQQMNAYYLVKQLGLAVEIRLDYREGSHLVLAEELEKGLQRLMDVDSEVRRKVKEMKELSRTAVIENGSSYESLGSLIEELMGNV